MKNLILAFCLMFAVGLTAQVTGPVLLAGKGNFKSTPTHAVTDTITNAVTEIQYGIIRETNQHVTVQSTYTKISGTAAATATLEGSINGVQYNTVPGSSAYTVTDTATQSNVWVVEPSPFQYYRVKIVPTGTQSVKVVTDVLVRRQP